MKYLNALLLTGLISGQTAAQTIHFKFIHESTATPNTFLNVTVEKSRHQGHSTECHNIAPGKSCSGIVYTFWPFTTADLSGPYLIHLYCSMNYHDRTSYLGQFRLEKLTKDTSVVIQASCEKHPGQEGVFPNKIIVK